VNELTSEFKHLTKTLPDDDTAHTEGARDFNQSLKIAVHRTVEKPLRSDAGTSVQQPQAQQREVQRLTTALAESNSESDSSLQQHFLDWKMFDGNGCVKALKQLDDKSLKEEFQHFADIKKDGITPRKKHREMYSTITAC